MFGSGKSKAKREALKAQSTQIWGQLSELVAGPRAKLLDDLEVEGAQEYNAKVKQYNTRIDEVARQMKGQDITERIMPVQKEYVSKVSEQLKAKRQNTIEGAAGIMGQSRGNNIQDILRGRQSPEAEALSYLQGKDYLGNIDGALTRFNDPLVKEFQAKTNLYKGFGPSYRTLSTSKAVFEDLSKLAESVNLTGKKNKIQDQLDFKASASGQTLAAQQKAARKSGRNSTILTGIRG